MKICPFDKLFGIECDEHDVCAECPHKTWEECCKEQKENIKTKKGKTK